MAKLRLGFTTPAVVSQPERPGEIQMRQHVENDWTGWDGDTIVRLTDGSVWRQEEYHYEYRYAYRPL